MATSKTYSVRAVLRVATLWTGFFLLALIAALIRPMEIPGGLTLYSTADEAATAFGGDVGAYIDYADSMLRTGRFDEIQLQRLYQPVTSLAMALVFKTMGRDNFLLHMLLISAACFATAFCFLYRALDFVRSPLLRFSLVNSMWLFHSFPDWCLKTGSFFSESRAMPFFLVSLSCLVVALREKKGGFWIMSSLAMAAATYTRVYFETVGQFLLLGVWAATSLNVLQGKTLPPPQRLLVRREWRWATVALVLFVAALLPWKQQNKKTGNGFAMGPAHYWMTFHNLWTPPEERLEFIIGSSTACVVDPELCQIFRVIRDRHANELGVPFRIYRNAAIMTLLSRAKDWYAHRFSVFWKFWADFPRPSSAISVARSNLEGVLVIVLALISIALSLSHLRQPGPQRVWAFVILAFSIQTFAMITFGGMDYRHSLPVRLFFYWALPLGVAVAPQAIAFRGKLFPTLFGKTATSAGSPT